MSGRSARKVRSESSIAVARSIVCLLSNFDQWIATRRGSARHRAAAGRSARAGQWLACAPQPPQRKLQRWRLAHHQRSRRDRTTNRSSRAVHTRLATGGAVLWQIAAASRRDHLPCVPLQAARGHSRSGHLARGGLLSYGPDANRPLTRPASYVYRIRKRRYKKKEKDKKTRKNSFTDTNRDKHQEQRRRSNTTPPRRVATVT